MHTTADQIVRDYLDDLEHLLRHADAASVAVMTPTELERTIRALRAILMDHALDMHRRCRRCTTRLAWRWAPWLRSRPCRAWQLAHQHLVVDAPLHPTGPILALGGPR
jgi:hypothetical protein